ncbi:protein HAIKU1-like [Lotus japonicus]|uniref:protein HAIKU1-like n=1 Tax=Lotus japonicus TaxID=34305 RepID=UPI00258826BB|nr:protein HAIKU1-like [Lotus japonicus]
MDNSKNRHNDSLGVNKMGKNIRKSPLHQPNFGNNNAARQQPQPQVYNISKNDFRDIVQQLTGSPSQDPLPRPPHNPPKPQSMRLQKIRPPPLSPINRPRLPPPMPMHAAPPPVPYNNPIPRPPAHFGQPSPTPMQPLTPGDLWANTTESPISAYMRYLQNSMMDPGSRGNHNQVHPQPHPYPYPQPQGPPGHVQSQPPSSALLPNPPMPPIPSPRFNGPIPHMNATNHPPPYIPSPHGNGPPLLPSPTSQFLLPSPTGYMNLLSPRSPYPLLSPGIQFPSPFTPNFPFSPMAQSGILGPGPQPPPSPGLFPLSPSAFFPISSPRWRDH